MSKQNITFE